MNYTAGITDLSTAPWLEGIEGETASSLIDSNAPIIRVIAGPGAGKTTCLKRRIQRLVQRDRVNPETIFVGTFTRAVANELTDALGTEVRVSTLHSYAYNLLRKYPAACQGLQLRFLLKYEEDAMLHDIGEMSQIGGNIYERRNALRSLQASRAQRTDYGNAQFAGAVRDWLSRHHAMLINEVVYLAVVGLESEDIPKGEFDYVVVDEYQDLTAAEQELVRLMWSGLGSLLVLGDDDQSIYGFRFSHPEGISSFAETWSQCKDIAFSENRRCGENILETANLMMAEAGSDKPPMTWHSGREGDLKVVQWETLDEEINGIAEYVNGRNEESFLILVPRRFVGYRLAEAIGSDARTAFSEQVLDHKVAQDAFAAASLVADPEDFVAARAYLAFNGNNREHGPRHNAGAYSLLPPTMTRRELMSNVASGLIAVTGEGQSHVTRRAEKALGLIDRSFTAEEAIDHLFYEELANEEPDEEKRRWLTDNLSELRNAAHELLSTQEAPDLARIMATLRYRIATRLPLRVPEDQEPRVKIMTLHSAKGLEADNVVIAGVTDQFMPGKETDSEIMAEQKRLLYVGVTRARDNLIISWSRRVQTADVNKNMGRLGQVITENGVTWAITSRSRLLPQGLAGVISGEQLIASLPHV